MSHRAERYFAIVYFGHVLRRSKGAERTGAFCVGLAPLGLALAVEKFRHLFKKDRLIQHDRAIAANGQRMFITLNANTCVSGGGRGSAFYRSSCSYSFRISLG